MKTQTSLIYLKKNLLGFLRDFYQCVLHVNYLWKLGNNGDLNILSLTSYYSTKQKPKTQLTNRTSHYSTILNNNKKPYLYAWLQDRLVFKISGCFFWVSLILFCSVLFSQSWINRRCNCKLRFCELHQEYIN